METVAEQFKFLFLKMISLEKVLNEIFIVLRGTRHLGNKPQRQCRGLGVAGVRHFPDFLYINMSVSPL